MARQRRFCLPGQPQHVIQRGNNRDITFIDKQDYHFYLESLADACQKHDCEIHAYVCMTNHVHLLVTPLTEYAISRTMQSLGRRYVQHFNHRYQRTGTLWEGRYKATLIDTEDYLLACYRYIEQNPVRAGMVTRPALYAWSSFRHNGLGKPDPLLTEHPLYQNLAMDRAKRLSRYRALFDTPVSRTTLSEIREATNKAWVLGNDRFREQMEEILERQAAPRLRGGDRKSGQYRERSRINRV